MKQSHGMSLIEAATNTIVGYGLAVATQLAIFPFFDLPARVNDALIMGIAFTIISILRSYVLRRVFEAVRTTTERRHDHGL